MLEEWIGENDQLTHQINDMREEQHYKTDQNNANTQKLQTKVVELTEQNENLEKLNQRLKMEIESMKQQRMFFVSFAVVFVSVFFGGGSIK